MLKHKMSESIGFKKKNKEINSETLEEFKRRLKENISVIYIGDNTPMRVIQEVTIDRILKEMEGEVR